MDTSKRGRVRMNMMQVNVSGVVGGSSEVLLTVSLCVLTVPDAVDERLREDDQKPSEEPKEPTARHDSETINTKAFLPS